MRLVPYLKYYQIHFIAHRHLKMCASVKLCSDSIIGKVCVSEGSRAAWRPNFQVKSGRSHTWRNINVVATSIEWRASYTVARWTSYCALWNQLWCIGDISEEHRNELSQVGHHSTCIWHLRRSCGKIIEHACIIMDLESNLYCANVPGFCEQLIVMSWYGIRVLITLSLLPVTYMSLCAIGGMEREMK